MECTNTLDDIVNRITAKLMCINKKIPLKVRSIFIVLLFFAASLICWLNPIVNFKNKGYFLIAIAMIASFLCLEKNINRINYKLIIPIIFIGIIYACKGIIFMDANAIIIGGTFIVCIPIISTFLSERENANLFIINFAWGTELLIIPIIIVSIILAPPTAKQYSSIMLNPNLFATITMIIVISSLILFYYSKKFRIVHLFVFGLGISYMLITKSRTGFLVITVCMIFLTIYLIYSSKKISKVFMQIVMFGVIICFTLAINVYGFNAINDIVVESKLNDNKRVELYSTTEIIKIENENDLNYYKEKDKIISETLDRVDKGINDESEISSGRIDIWKACTKELNIVGHSSINEFFVKERNLWTNDTHNFILQTGWEIGIIGMFVLILLIIEYIIIAFRRIILCIKYQEIELIDLFYLMISIAFFITATMSGDYLLTTSIWTIGFWSVFALKMPIERNCE